MRDHATLRALRGALHRDPGRRPPRPPLHPQGIPADLAELPQWVVWRYAWVAAKGKWDKPPRTFRGGAAKSNDPNTWATFADALAAYRADPTLDGLGFMFRAGGGRFGLDGDNCRDPDTGELSGDAREILGRFPTYAEVSPSGFGFKLIGRGEVPGGKGRKNRAADLEVYSAGRFFALTGLALPDSPADVRDCSAGLAWLWPKFFPAQRAKDRGTRTAATPAPPAPGAAGPGLSDDEVFDRLFRLDPKAAAISRLWHGDTSDHAGDDSAADMALVNHIAYYVGPDRRRIDRLFRQSPLCRPKWDGRRGESTYGWWTIDKVLATKTNFFVPEIRVTMKTTNVGANGRNSRDATAGKGDRPAGWGPPAALPEMPSAPPFPLSLFPARLADYWAAAAESLHVPPDYIAVPALPLLGAAVGRSRAASVKRTYAEPALLWAVLVAPPGRAKSPALRFAKGPLSSHTRRWREQYRDKAARYEADLAAYNAAFAKWSKSPEGNPPRKPDKPMLTQLVIDKFTVESLVRINADNPRGVVLAQDELAGLVTGLGQYKARGGDDKQTLLSLWAGAEAEVNRVKDKDAGGLPLYVPHTFVGVAGMIQPDLLAVLRGDFGRAEFVNDGWADRFLLSFPDPPPLVGETWATVPENLERGYADVYERLLALEMKAEADAKGTVHRRPYYLPFDRSAVAAWQEFTDGVAARANALDRADNYVGVLSKLKHYGLRLTTLVYCVRAACGEVEDGMPVDGETVRRAAALVDYFDAHGRRCLGVGWADRSVRVAGRLIAWLCRNPSRVGFNRTEAFLAVKDRRDVRTSEALNPAFRLLVDHNYIRPLDRPENARPGPIPETYAVNPGWVRTP